MTISTRILGIILLFLLSLSLAAPAAAQVTLVVTNTNSGNTSGGCDADCSLLDAIDTSENSVGVQTITFNIPGTGVHTILTASGFQIHQSVIIDATTQPNYTGKPLIQINPSSPTSPTNGFFVDGSGFTFDPTLSVTIRGLAVGGFHGIGIYLGNGQNHLIEQNFVGINADGTTAHANDNGIIMHAPTSIIRNNVISGNLNTGLSLGSNGGKNSLNNQIVGNFIGTNFDGTAAIPNHDGIYVREAANNNTIGGTSVADRNIISGNTQWGIFTDGRDSEPTLNTNSTTILGNYIGTDVTGTLDLGNGNVGIFIQRSDSNIIGGTTGTTPGGSCTGACNLISGNSVGIGIVGDDLGTSENNLVQGNFIGTDASGTAIVPNSIDGIDINSSLNTIGGTTPQARNLVSGNNANGIFISGANSFGNVVLGNYIGTETTGLLPLGNRSYGIYASGDAFGSQIGDGTDQGANWIGFNGETDNKAGIGISGGDLTSQNRISGNSIFYNFGLGIDLRVDGVTPNDPNDTDGLANGQQNFPVLTGILTRSNTIINGTLNSAANRNYTIELYANTDCDESGYGEGEFLVGGASVTTDGSGNANFQDTISPALPAYAQITALAIDEDSTPNSLFVWNTSEFSACQIAQSDLSLTKTDSVDPVLPGDNLTYTMVITNPANASYAENTVLADILPLGLSYVSTVSTQGTCSYDTPTRVVTCDVGQVTNGSTVTVMLNTTVDANIATASVNNSATVTSDTADPVTANNTASQSTAIAQANMGITMTDTPDPIAVDALLTYKLNVTNLGPHTATNVSVNDTLPANITFVDVTASQGTCTPGSGTVSCSLGSLIINSSATVTIIIRPNYGTQNTTLSSTAAVAALQVDTVTTNNSVTASTKVIVGTGAPMPYFFITPTPQLTWTGVTWATAYKVEVDDTNTFANPNFSADNLSPSTLSVVTSPLADGLWYWRVQAKRADGTWTTSAVMSFVVDQP